MIRPDQIPDDVVEAGARAMCRKAYERLPSFDWEQSMADEWDGAYWRGCSRAAIAAAFSAWPGAEHLAKTSIWISGADVPIPARINLPMPEQVDQ